MLCFGQRFYSNRIPGVPYSSGARSTLDIFQYLSSLSRNDLEELYSDTFTCQAILRSLPPRCKQYILKMLLIESIQVNNVSSWTAQSNKQTHLESLERLEDLKILIKQEFQSNIKESITNMKNVVVSAVERVEPNLQMSVDQLDSYSKSQWEKVLYFLSDDSETPPELIADLLALSNLTKLNDGSMVITSEGFKFLLKDIYTQIWTLIIVYLNSLETRGKSRRDALAFLFKLSFLSLGSAYYVNDLTEDEKSLLFDLRQFGLVYIRSEKSEIFYPTRLIISLTTGKTVTVIKDLAKEMSNTQKEQGYIILETNFRIYAYTASSLQISLLSLFVKMLYRLPNLSVGILTRESIRTAFLHGITADQIVDFIKQNGHPNMLKVGAPEIVFEQIRIWENERNRILYKKAVLFDSFPTQESFNMTLQYAKDLSFYMWASEAKKVLVVSDNGFDAIKNYIRKNFA
ncbi:general transcription factor IIH [Heterostelium album PN500]|uniref:General transcription factor IIH subunit 4 n=1 Tax=Heterostelium pallidum (strain ATCC 26659 / Pp 5 / PN500) TaxID=670386 RepID=D3B7P9_HETP5|nr:general transcription factor IIH [Heterostelium album PN500]EFA82792.1 general transcription factor IIH [Heterostelium album PN500]|eukprot:XP_020434909.1 general transcription factor IIH [Heterostelium album PN500]